jgi:purine-nucleoside phosphorylase
MDEVEDPLEVAFSEVPGFFGAGVAGHAGRWLGGRLGGVTVLLQSGRYHFYEGHPAQVVVAPIRLAARLGVRIVILTNAAGGINPELSPGSIMLLEDHQNHQGRSPLAGPVMEGEDRFPDLSAPFDVELQKLAMEAARRARIRLLRGTYAAVLGPSYETPAEIRYLRRLGADAVGMSTVPEAIVALALGLRVVGFSLITNRAAGLSRETLDHADVLAIGSEAGPRLQRLVKVLVEELPG